MNEGVDPLGGLWAIIGQKQAKKTRARFGSKHKFLMLDGNKKRAVASIFMHKLAELIRPLCVNFSCLFFSLSPLTGRFCRCHLSFQLIVSIIPERTIVSNLAKLLFWLKRNLKLKNNDDIMGWIVVKGQFCVG